MALKMPGVETANALNNRRIHVLVLPGAVIDMPEVDKEGAVLHPVASFAASSAKIVLLFGAVVTPMTHFPAPETSILRAFVLPVVSKAEPAVEDFLVSTVFGDMP